MSDGTRKTWGEYPLPEIKLNLDGRYLAPECAPMGFICRRVYIPDDPQFIAAVNELLSRLTFPDVWEDAEGTLSADECAWIAANMWDSMEDEYCMIGVIFSYITAAPPRCSLPCDGSVYQIADYPQLAAALDPAFIVDALTFRVPDLRDKTVIGAGSTRAVGDTGGAESVTLTTDQLPSHSHTAQPHSHTNVPHAHSYASPIPLDLDLEDIGIPQITAQRSPIGEYSSFETIVIDSATVAIDATGGGQPVEVIPPYVALKYAVWAR